MAPSTLMHCDYFLYAQFILPVHGTTHTGGSKRALVRFLFLFLLCLFSFSSTNSVTAMLVSSSMYKINHHTGVHVQTYFFLVCTALVWTSGQCPMLFFII